MPTHVGLERLDEVREAQDRERGHEVGVGHSVAAVVRGAGAGLGRYKVDELCGAPVDGVSCLRGERSLTRGGEVVRVGGWGQRGRSLQTNSLTV